MSDKSSSVAHNAHAGVREPKLVMVVVDDAPLRESVCDALEDEGYRVVPTETGIAAWNHLKSDAPKPDVILLDLMMPVMNGRQFREQQLSDPDLARIPVVVMTANRELRGMHADEVILKPLKLDTLLDIVRRHVAGGPAPVAENDTRGVTLENEREAARQGAERFRFMAEGMPQKVFTATPSGDVDYFNRQWMEFTGLSFETIRDWGWTQFIHADDVDENIRRWRHSIETGEPFELEHRFRAADGSYRWHLSRAHLMRDADGKAVMWLGSNTDIDDVKRVEDKLRQSERNLTSLFMQAPAAICILKGQDLRFELANPLYLMLTGRTADILGKPLLEVLPEIRGQGFDDMLREVIRSGEPFIGAETLANFDRRGDGTTEDSWWKYIFAPMRNPSGATDRVMALVHEVTEQVLASKEREGHIEELQRTIRFSEVFVGMLGHDLRNPLSAIMTAANLLEVRADSEKIAKPVSRIVQSAERMDRMISQLLDFTRIRLGGGIPLDPSQLDLAEVTRLIIDEQRTVQNREIQLSSVGDVVGTWDRDRLCQVLSNLVANACQHGSPGAPILIALDGSKPDTVRLTVSNRGAIPPELLPLIFDPLRSEEQQEKRNGASGLGLGLYITQQIAVAHNGTINVESTAEHGTRFTVELPRSGPGGAERALDVEVFTTTARHRTLR